MRVCSVHGCGEIYPAAEGSRCNTHRAQADKARGSAHNRGYTGRGHRAFRNEVLTRDSICSECSNALATVADHYPHSRKELIALGFDPNNPQYGRGLCKRCHDRSTAQMQPGGWNAE